MPCTHCIPTVIVHAVTASLDPSVKKPGNPITQSPLLRARELQPSPSQEIPSLSQLRTHRYQISLWN
ncbi:hypothetical protein PIB30_021713 [Stylosanthes scabra]|uniref:Uncharacterized protein n=1 Tax=Stylosanthes scabra TaxID=79078 RepID=A0ABU6S8G1_9FABA|nr:hypothetical protein [Stylosanthes scabra]